MSQNSHDLDMAVLARFIALFTGFSGDSEEFCKQIEIFREVIIGIAKNLRKIPDPGVEYFVDSQISALWNHIESVQRFPSRCATQRFTAEEEGEIAKLVAMMMDDKSVNDFADTKPYTDHWGGLSDKDLRELACRIYRELKWRHNGRKMWHGLSFAERLEDMHELVLKCKGTVYAMYKPTLFDECIRDPRGMHIRFVDNQKNNSNKKKDSRMRKLMEAEVEDQNDESPSGTGRGKKRRVNKKKDQDEEDFITPSGADGPPKPAKPQARKGLTIPKEPAAPKAWYRGPKFRAQQQKQNLGASSARSLSAAPPSGAEASHSNAPTGGPATPRDAARAIAQVLVVEAPRAIAHREYVEPRGVSRKRAHQNYDEPEVPAHKRARRSAAESGFAGNEGGTIAYLPDNNNFAMGHINTPSEQLHGPSGSYFDERSGFPGNNTQFSLPNANIQHLPFQVTAEGSILVTPNADTLRQELGMGERDYSMNMPTPIAYGGSTISGAPLHIPEQSIFDAPSYFQSTSHHVAGSSNAQAQPTYWDGTFETDSHQRVALPATGGSSLAPVSYPVRLLDQEPNASGLGSNIPLPEFAGGRAVGPPPMRYLRDPSLVGGRQEAPGGIRGTKSRVSGTIQASDPFAAESYQLCSPAGTNTPGAPPWDAEWDTKPGWDDDSQWEDPTAFDQGAKLEPLGPPFPVTPAPEFDEEEEKRFIDTLTQLGENIDHGFTP